MNFDAQTVAPVAPAFNVTLSLSARELEDLYHFLGRHNVGNKRPRTRELVGDLYENIGQVLDDAGINVGTWYYE